MAEPRLLEGLLGQPQLVPALAQRLGAAWAPLPLHWQQRAAEALVSSLWQVLRGTLPLLLHVGIW